MRGRGSTIIVPPIVAESARPVQVALNETTGASSMVMEAVESVLGGYARCIAGYSPVLHEIIMGLNHPGYCPECFYAAVDFYGGFFMKFVETRGPGIVELSSGFLQEAAVLMIRHEVLTNIRTEYPYGLACGLMPTTQTVIVYERP